MMKSSALCRQAGPARAGQQLTAAILPLPTYPQVHKVSTMSLLPLSLARGLESLRRRTCREAPFGMRKMQCRRTL